MKKNTNFLKAFFDKRLSKKLIRRLKTIEKEEWIGINHTFNRWHFPVQFYDLIPKWWGKKCTGERAHKLIRPVMDVAAKDFSYFDMLYYHNVINGKMTKDQFKYWFDNVRDGNADTNTFQKYYYREGWINNIHWWEDETFEKIQSCLGIDEQSTKAST